jgi:hypothetical protein
MLPKLALEVTDLIHGSPLLGDSNFQTSSTVYTLHSLLRNSSIKKIEHSMREFFINSTRLAGAH